MKISIIDYEIGNVKSIKNALKKIGVESILTNDRKTILSSDGLILPGVGAFAHGMNNLQKYGLQEIINDFVNTKKPFMGICLGMQMLMEESEEFGITKGLGLIEGKVIKLPVQKTNYEKSPHVSWNEIVKNKITWKDTILGDIPEQSDMYFVHSFVASPMNEENILSTTEYYDYKFCSAVKKDNIYGCQFHPEKSGKMGLNIIQNFVNLCKERKNV
ncbi:MAG: imidazole glycerol phosphate synthase subunit HisH [Sulfurimonas sp.]|uniref:imidazole glycerol phosphate synthase subunit HisH n=1 Tax=Sulfurimonas sp. TaxID=2022749 RepID=UPI0025EB3778|nr:imidazole glycerol phosphate synthase subunit HisH [Sulfurimonas sp.]MCK9491399.1 imidazole glycerol phosphate synthase subunit HisH [Sulfurimonas sp.]